MDGTHIYSQHYAHSNSSGEITFILQSISLAYIESPPGRSYMHPYCYGRFNIRMYIY